MGKENTPPLNEILDQMEMFPASIFAANFISSLGS